MTGYQEATSGCAIFRLCIDYIWLFYFFIVPIKVLFSLQIKALQICLDILTDKSTPKDMSYVPTNVDSSSGHLLREGKNVDK